jgi:hypothetical protein
MDQTAIFEPFVATMMLTLVVWFYMYARRLTFIARHDLSPRDMTPSELARLSPTQVANPSDNLKNLFEVPTVFYAVILYLYVTQQVESHYLWAAWIFFGFRVLHSVVHCTCNFIPLRFALYIISTLALWYMLARISLRVLL